METETRPLRTIKRELEARLSSSGGGRFSRPSGKLERKSYGDARERLKITLRNLKVSDGASAVVWADGLEIAQIAIKNGSGRYDEESARADAFPELGVGQTIEVRLEGHVVLHGVLALD